jgi:hypothetical protein
LTRRAAEILLVTSDYWAQIPVESIGILASLTPLRPIISARLKRFLKLGWIDSRGEIQNHLAVALQIIVIQQDMSPESSRGCLHETERRQES